MKKFSLLFLILLSACAPSRGASNNPDINIYQPEDEQMSCDEIRNETQVMNEILAQEKSVLDDPIARQVGRQTVSTAGQTAAAGAGAGQAGPFIGIFVNAITSMAMRKDETPSELIGRAQSRRAVLSQLSREKSCS